MHKKIKLKNERTNALKIHIEAIRTILPTKLINYYQPKYNKIQFHNAKKTNQISDGGDF